MIHELKTSTKYFSSVKTGKKSFEVRKNDRDFRAGDLLALNEFDDGAYTGRSCLVYVDYILDDPEYVNEGFVIMSVKPCEVYRYGSPYNPCKKCADYSVPLASDDSESDIE